jgi:uncharacterized protein (TIGR02270 family)
LSVVPVVLDQHAEEAAILWLRRDWAVDQPHYTLADLAKLDGQLDAQLDGLRIGGQAAWEICRQELRWGEPGEVFAAALLAFESGAQDRIKTVLEAASESYELSRAAVAALAWLPYDAAAAYIQRFLADGSPSLRRLAIAASAAHRRDPGGALGETAADPDPLLKARALRAAGELGRTDLLPALRASLAADDPSCRFAAAWAVALLAGDAAAIDVLRQIVETNVFRDSHSEKALKLALRRLEIAASKDWIDQLVAGGRKAARLGVVGAGVIGTPECIPLLLDQMQVPELARAAGEALTMITGLDIAYEGMEGPWPKGFVAGPTEDPKDENVAMDPDENLPWPNRERLLAWWQSHRNRFEPGVRYLCGRPVGSDSLQEVLRGGRQRQRAAAALELAIRQPGRPLFEVRAPGRRQQQMLS